MTWGKSPISQWPGSRASPKLWTVVKSWRLWKDWWIRVDYHNFWWVFSPFSMQKHGRHSDLSLSGLWREKTGHLCCPRADFCECDVLPFLGLWRNLKLKNKWGSSSCRSPFITQEWTIIWQGAQVHPIESMNTLHQILGTLHKVLPSRAGGTRSGKVRVCEAGPLDPRLPPSIRKSLKKTPPSIRSAMRHVWNNRFPSSHKSNMFMMPSEN